MVQTAVSFAQSYQCGHCFSVGYGVVQLLSCFDSFPFCDASKCGGSFRVSFPFFVPSIFRGRFDVSYACRF